MPDFSVNVVASPPDVETVAWEDPATSDAPSRLNPDDIEHRYWRVDYLATVEFRAVVDGTEAPADAALGGRLFTWTWVEGAHDGASVTPPAIVSPAGGKSSVATVDTSLMTYVSDHGAEGVGHFAIQCRREDGGSVIIPFEVES